MQNDPGMMKSQGAEEVSLSPRLLRDFHRNDKLEQSEQLAAAKVKMLGKIWVYTDRM